MEGAEGRAVRLHQEAEGAVRLLQMKQGLLGDVFSRQRECIGQLCASACTL